MRNPLQRCPLFQAPLPHPKGRAACGRARQTSRTPPWSARDSPCQARATPPLEPSSPATRSEPDRCPKVKVNVNVDAFLMPPRSCCCYFSETAPPHRRHQAHLQQGRTARREPAPLPPAARWRARVGFSLGETRSKVDECGGLKWMSAARAPQVLPASSRQAVDGMFRAINDARGFAAQAAQTLTARARPPETSRNGSSGCNGSKGGRTERRRAKMAPVAVMAPRAGGLSARAGRSPPSARSRRSACSSTGRTSAGHAATAPTASRHLSPPPRPPSRTNWTRLVPPSVVTGHVSPRRSGQRGRRRRVQARAVSLRHPPPPLEPFQSCPLPSPGPLTPPRH